MSDAIVAVSVDLDTLGHYHGIHGLEAPVGDGDPIYRTTLPRFTDLFDAHGIPATFFAIGQDVTRWADAGRALRALAEAGHEIANHSLRHRYDLSVLGRREVEAEIAGSHDAISGAVGTAFAPRGFRAPGYNLSTTILEQVAAQGYRWDSSIFPCPAYYLAKWGVMAAMKASGRFTAAVAGDPMQLLAPTEPYRPAAGSVWRSGTGPVLELPVAVLPGVRGPFIGTSLVLAGDTGAGWMTSLMSRARFVNLELHGIDLLDKHDEGVSPELVAKQPDMRLSGSEKRTTLSIVLERLARTHRFVTLSEAAELYGA